LFKKIFKANWEQADAVHCLIRQVDDTNRWRAGKQNATIECTLPSGTSISELDFWIYSLSLSLSLQSGKQN